jgi:PAS domain S-box-containing protein
MTEKQQPTPAANKMLIYGICPALFLLGLLGLLYLTSMIGDVEQPSPTQLFFAFVITVVPFMMFAVMIALAILNQEIAKLGGGYLNRMSELYDRVHHNEDLVHIVADHQPAGITIYDDKNDFWFLNRHAAEYLGESIQNVLHRNIRQIFSKADADRLLQYIDDARTAGTSMTKIDRRLVAGQPRFMQLQIIPNVHLDHRHAGVMVLEEDMTATIVEREKREHMLRQMVDTLVTRRGSDNWQNKLPKSWGLRQNLSKPPI